MSDGSSRLVEFRRFLTNLILPELVRVAISFELLIRMIACWKISRGVLIIARVFPLASSISNNLQSEPFRQSCSKSVKSSLVGVFSI